MKKLCLYCNESLSGRSDKKFCDDQCRSSHFQKTKTEVSDSFKLINKVLKNNRLILIRLNPSGKTKTTRAMMMTAGFDLNFHTHLFTTSTGNTYVFCYDYGYLELQNNEFLLVKRVPKL